MRFWKLCLMHILIAELYARASVAPYLINVVIYPSKNFGNHMTVPPTDRPPVHTNDVRKVKERVCNIEWSFLCPQMQLRLTLKPKIGKNKKKPQYSKPIFSLTTLIFAKCQGLQITEIFAWGIRSPSSTDKESVIPGIHNLRPGIQNPRLFWIPYHGDHGASHFIFITSTLTRVLSQTRDVTWIWTWSPLFILSK